VRRIFLCRLGQASWPPCPVTPAQSTRSAAPGGPASLALELQGPASGSLNGPFVEAELARASRADPLLLATRYVSHVSLYLQDRAAHVVARNADWCCGDRDDPERGCRSASGNDDVRLRGKNPAERCAAGESGCYKRPDTRIWTDGGRP